MGDGLQNESVDENIKLSLSVYGSYSILNVPKIHQCGTVLQCKPLDYGIWTVAGFCTSLVIGWEDHLEYESVSIYLSVYDSYNTPNVSKIPHCGTVLQYRPL